MAQIEQFTLNDQTSLPALGLGTYSLDGDEGAEAMAQALKLGYRLLDSALAYQNEDAVGNGVRKSGLDRDEVLVTSKLPDEYHGRAATREAFEMTRNNLGLDHVDLYLIHWPVPEKDLYVESWRTMIDLQSEGKIRSIGVSNFNADQLDRLIDETGVTPAVNQVPVHVFEQQPTLRKDNADRGILTQAYSPLKFGDSLRSNNVLTNIANAHGVTVSQVALRWNLQLGTLPIPRSRSVEHLKENLEVLLFALTDQEMARIDKMPAYPGSADYA